MLILFENSYLDKSEDWFKTKEDWHLICHNSKEELFCIFLCVNILILRYKIFITVTPSTICMNILFTFLSVYFHPQTIEFVINMEGQVFPRLTSDAQSHADVPHKKVDSFQETVTVRMIYSVIINNYEIKVCVNLWYCRNRVKLRKVVL